MALTKQRFTSYLKSAEFRTLFIEEMGWNKISAGFASLPTFYVEEKPFNITAIAQRNGFQVLVCNVEELPSNSTCKKLDTKLRRAANDYICIFVIPGTEHHQWVAPVKTNEKRDIVIIEYAEAEKAQFLYEKIAGLSFDIDEATTIVDVKERIQGAFAINSEKITKDFYSGFNKEHKAFAEFITGIDDQTATKDNKNKQWYTSVMLNRLMFCYFIQKKGFLNGDENYLSNKLRWVQEKKGKNQFFHSFYKGFLVQLFRGGLNSPKHDEAFEDMYGRIPYLNGGMFDVHQIERVYADIDIRDEAFESLFAFFDKWRWHLDTRVTASGRDINPDVLGYIFEQYINDRAQMGAYYTKEDITEYIGRNTIIPYLFDAVAKKYPQAFEQNAPFWEFIYTNGEDFIYDAVKKGVHETLPEDIACGIDTEVPNLLERRKLWNNTTPANFGLPTEIWRETIERRQRYNEIVGKLHSGELRSFNDFITYNLNTPKIAYDFLNYTNDKKIIDIFYGELLKITILDPTCGSGAFLFAALNLLEPLYEVCISRMEEFNSQDHELFKDQLAEIKNKYRSNIQYFIYKSIILRNLYGVDIMAEAVEIAKLRLFLKMVAVVEVDKRADNMGLDPLPDVDFNIRCGNTLVGYATEEQLIEDLNFDSSLDAMFANQELKDKLDAKLADVADTYEVFRLEQFEKDVDIATLKDAKRSLNSELEKLNDLLNRHLFAASGYPDYKEWLESHQPFHWMAEFYLIMHGNNGFDVIIGNPPYVEYSKVRKYYTLDNYRCLDSGNLYAYVIERSLGISHVGSRNGMIIQMSAFCTPRMQSFQDVWLEKAAYSSVAFFDDRPGKLFDNLQHIRVVIPIMEIGDPSTRIGTTRYNKFYTQCRGILFQTLMYYPSNDSRKEFSVIKIHTRVEESIVNKLWRNRRRVAFYENPTENSNFVYYGYGYGYFGKILNFKSYFKGEKIAESTGDKYYYINPSYDRDIFVALLNSSLFYWFYVNYSDGHNFTKTVIGNMPFDYDALGPYTEELKNLVKELMTDLSEKSGLKVANYKSTGKVEYAEYYPKKSKHIIDKIDGVLAKYYQFTPEELDFILNYDVKFRMGDELLDE